MDELERLKAACARLSVGGFTGTGYLVGADRIATCEHVVREAGSETIKVRFEGDEADLGAVVEKLDPQTDSALLKLAAPIATRVPLELAQECRGRAEWVGFGFPIAANRAGLPIFGTVLDPRSTTDHGKPSLTLRSPEAAAGMATSLGGFSGTPVMVEGLVIGHLSKVISDPEHPGRPAYGYVYATRAEAVATLAGITLRKEAVPPPVKLLGDMVRPVPEGHFHAFISYRSTDREAARALTTRLEARGLRVFLAEKDLQPGARLANQLDSALKNSGAGIVLMSKEWFDSPWCQEEANALETRSVEDPQFPLIPIRLDATQVPPFLAGRIYVDLRGKPLTGKESDAVVAAILGIKLDHLSASSRQIDASLSETVDEGLDRIKRLKVRAKLGGAAILEELRIWRAAGLPMSAVSVTAADLLISCGKNQEALQVLAEAPESLRTRQLQALAHARDGELDDAQLILEELRQEGHFDGETSGLYGGLMRRRWLESNEPRYLRSAYLAYREAYERTGNSYPGINAASLALQVEPEFGGGREHSRAIARQLLETLGTREVDELDHWQLATIGEAKLLLEQIDEAAGWYGKAVIAANEQLADLGVMRAQARRNLRGLGKDPSTLDHVFGSLRVAVFTGHLTDAPNRAVPRFPESKVAAAQRVIQHELEGLQIRQGFASASRGADLLFIEALLRRSGAADVYLPFRREDFVRISVGDGWSRRFETILKHARVHLHERDEPAPADPSEQGNAFAQCNEEIAEGAIHFGELAEETPILIALWNGNPGDGGGGTSSAIERWKQRGLPVEVIDLTGV